MNIKEYFSSLEDTRVQGMILHFLTDIIGIATLAGCEEWQDIAEHGQSYESDLKK